MNFQRVRTAILAFFLLGSWQLQADIIVRNESITYSGYSNISSDKATIYGGIAGDVSGGSSNGTLNTCEQTSLTAVEACNQNSVHPSLLFRVSFQVTKDVSSAAAVLCLSSGTSCGTTLQSSTVSATGNSTTITMEADWGDICAAVGLNSSCTGASSAFYSNQIKFGVDGDNSGSVEDDELKSVALKVHYISTTDVNVTQTFCATDSTGDTSGKFGMCNIEFYPGDQKAFINSAIYAGNATDTNAIAWDAIAVFPVLVTGSDVSTITGFVPNQATPIFKSFNADDGTIPDSAVSGGNVQNGDRYCFVYGTRNLAHNIYRFVTDSAAASTACLEPSEVVGLLNDKACVISTAAFGSVMAPEVQSFREFRNQFLLSSKPGRYLVKKYYEYGTPAAGLIAQNELLRTLVRWMLYPVLLYVQLTLSLGILMGSLSLFALVIGLYLAITHLRDRRWLIMILILGFVPQIKAEVRKGETLIQHEGAKEGLVRIRKDGTYVYDTKRELKKESSRVTLGAANYPDITIDVETGSGTQTYSFEELYAASPALILGYDYENFLWTDKGKLGYQIGTSLMYASGNGVLVSTGEYSLEKFTFLTVPINAGAVYRFEYKDRQTFAPYIAGGGTLLALIEKREDVSQPSFAGGFGFYGAGGVLLNTSIIDPDAGFDLENEYGISNLWISVEFRVTEVSGEAFSFSNQYVNAGLSFDF